MSFTPERKRRGWVVGITIPTPSQIEDHFRSVVTEEVDLRLGVNPRYDMVDEPKIIQTICGEVRLFYYAVINGNRRVWRKDYESPIGYQKDAHNLANMIVRDLIEGRS